MKLKSRMSVGVFTPVVLSLLAVFIAVWPGMSSALQYDRDAIADGQWHLLVTGQLTHFGTNHLVWDVGVLLVLGIACGLREPRRTFAAIAGAMLVIGPMLYCLWPDLAIYRGLSGVDSALFGLLVVSLARDAGARLRTVLAIGMAAFVVKLGYEAATGTALFVDSTAAGFESVPLAHLVGLVVGLIVGVVPHVRMPVGRLAMPAALVLLATTQSGCLTNAMWKRGVATTVGNPQVISGKTHGGVIIEYGEGNDTTQVLLPIDRTLDDIEPLRYTGSGRSLYAIEQDVTPAQARRVNRVVMPSAAPLYGREYRPAVLGNEARRGVVSDKLDLAVFAFDAAGDPVGDVVKLNSGRTGARFPDDCRIFLLPRTQPRDGGPIALDTIGLILVTPLTLAVDVFVTPVHLLSGNPLN